MSARNVSRLLVPQKSGGWQASIWQVLSE